MGIHPHTLTEVTPGSAVVIRDVSGRHHRRIATTGVVRGCDFLVVWVAREEEISAAGRERRDPDAVPWPAEDVWLLGDEPREDEDRGR